jgi:uncharacterized membrane protein YccC
MMDKREAAEKIAKPTKRWLSWQFLCEHLQLRLALKTGVAACLGWALGMGFTTLIDRPDRLVSGMWCTLSAIVVIQAHLGGTYKAAMMRFLGVFVGSLLGGLCTTFLGANPLSLGVSIFATVMICSLSCLKESIRIACMSVAVVMVLWGLQPHISPWTFALFRVLDSCVGITIAMVVAHILWPYAATQKIRATTAVLLSRLNQLYRFACRGDSEAETTKECERLAAEMIPMLQQNVVMMEEAKLELFTKPDRLHEWVSLHEELEQLFEFAIMLERVSWPPRKIYDESLKQKIDKVVNQMDEAFQKMSQAFVEEKAVGVLTPLVDAQASLQEDINRFRNTHTTRVYNLMEVESLFVFFYTLNAAIEEIFKAAKRMDRLAEPEQDAI